jgi:formylglycine-generating enzyme required for sulfatase activity
LSEHRNLGFWKRLFSRETPCAQCARTPATSMTLVFSGRPRTTCVLCKACAIEVFDKMGAEFQASHEEQYGLQKPRSAVATIPPGEFVMGSAHDDKYASSNERPAHKVVITRAFEMMTTPVTITQHCHARDRALDVEVVSSDGLRLLTLQYSFQPFPFKGNVTQALLHCNALSRRDGLREAYVVQGEGVMWHGLTHPGWRLPTEAEWEYACRAGTTGPQYGEIDEIAWWANNSGGDSHPVGQKKPNAWGLRDMLGNVGEWVWDRCDEFGPDTVVDPVGAYTNRSGWRDDNNGRFGVRGGDWSSIAHSLRASFRCDFAGFREFGLRPVRSLT